MEDDKAALRAGVRAARRALPDDERAALDEALARVALAPEGPLLALAPGDAVAVYASLPSEPGTRALRAALAARGLVVVLPVVLDAGTGIGSGGPGLAWEVDSGLGAQGAGVAWDGGLGAVAVVLVPALAVDGSGTRLGQGGGYYDRALAALPALVSPPALGTGGGRPPLVAVVREQEVLPAGTLPREDHDVAVDAALTPAGWVTLGS